MAEDRPPWKKPAPAVNRKRVALTPEWRRKAEARAKKAGRPYPNLVDNLWAAAQQKKGNVRERKA